MLNSLIDALLVRVRMHPSLAHLRGPDHLICGRHERLDRRMSTRPIDIAIDPCRLSPLHPGGPPKRSYVSGSLKSDPKHRLFDLLKNKKFSRRLTHADHDIYGPLGSL